MNKGNITDFVKFNLLPNFQHSFIDGFVEFAMGIVLVMCFILWFCKKQQYIGRTLLAFCIVVLLNLTVFSRPSDNSAHINLIPFWSYSVGGMQANKNILAEVLLNIVLFIPYGIVAGAVFARKWYVPMIFGMILSFMIELLQFILRKGLCETDDVIHNTFGCLIGVGIVKIVIKCWKEVKRCIFSWK